jgi:signal transduction histidine kinase
MKNSHATKADALYDEFEDVTRKLRWLCIFVVALVFPYSPDRFYLLVGLVVAGTLYNLSRYSKTLMRNKWFASAKTIIVLDNLFVCALIILLGNISSPFSAFLVFMIVTAAYRFRAAGALVVAISQSAILSIVLLASWFPPLELSPWRMIVIITTAFVGLGLLVERLTHLDRQERDTLRKLSREADSERSHLVALINSLTTAIFVVNNKGTIILYNDAATLLSGSSGSIRDVEFSDVMPLYVRTDVDAKQVKLFEKDAGNQRRRDLAMRSEDGQVTDLDVTIHTVQLEGVDAIDYIVACEDITRERSLDEQRSEFIAVASHELRTPLAIIEAALATALMSKEPLPAHTKTLLDQAHNNSIQLGGIIKDLSMLAEAKNDNLPIQLKQINPHEIVEQLARDFDAQAKQKGLSIIVDIDPRTPSVLSTEHHIREVLQNYMTNAVKYSDEGDVIIRAQPAKTGGVQFSVTDNGIGISVGDQKHLFTKFFRAEDYRTRRTGGTGLGLYLCQELANRMGGKVWCQSAINKGSTFYLSIPPFSGLSRDQGEIVQAQVANLVDGL